MKNLEQIKAAWAMGWSAVMSGSKHSPNGTIVSFYTCYDYIYLRVDKGTNIQLIKGKDKINEMEIVDYLYAGELAGNEPIPEGQKFRVNGGIGIFVESNEKPRITKSMVRLETNTQASFLFDKSEITPYFDD